MVAASAEVQLFTESRAVISRARGAARGDVRACVRACVQGTSDYYTMSSQGITHFWDGQADFCPLEQFERDYFLYSQLMKLKLFRMFRMWKAFKVSALARWA